MPEGPLSLLAEEAYQGYAQLNALSLSLFTFLSSHAGIMWLPQGLLLGYVVVAAQRTNERKEDPLG